MDTHGAGTLMGPDPFAEYLQTVRVRDVRAESFHTPAHRRMLVRHDSARAAYWAGRFEDSQFNWQLKQAGMHSAKWGATRRDQTYLGPMSDTHDVVKLGRKTPAKSPEFTAEQIRVATAALNKKWNKNGNRSA